MDRQMSLKEEYVFDLGSEVQAVWPAWLLSYLSSSQHLMGCHRVCQVWKSTTWLTSGGQSSAERRPRSIRPTSLRPSWRSAPSHGPWRRRCTRGTWAWCNSQRTCCRGWRWACRWGWRQRRCRQRRRDGPGWSQGTCRHNPLWKCSPEGQKPENSKYEELTIRHRLVVLKHGRREGIYFGSFFPQCFSNKFKNRKL